MLAALLAACGSSHSSGSAGGGADAERKPAAAPTGNASAEEVAAEQRGDVDCPADKLPAPAGTPVDDVLGVRPGLTYEQAARIVLCSNPLLVITDEADRGFNFPTYGQKLRQAFTARFAEPRVQKTSRQIIQEMEREATARGLNEVRHDMKPGQAKWFVSTMGMPGQEKVIGVAREEWFDEGRNPTIDSVQQALIGKYGAPSKTGGSNTYRQLMWIFDPRGRPVTETSPLYNQCSGIADPDGSMNLSPDCGVVVEAYLYGLRDNPALAQRMQVGVVDQAGGYAAVSATEQGLAALDAQRRAKQVQEAGKNAQAPSL
jgi:hypothetical protein